MSKLTDHAWFTEGLAKSLAPSMKDVPLEACAEHRQELIAWLESTFPKGHLKHSSAHAMVEDLRSGMRGADRFGPDMRIAETFTPEHDALARQVYASLVAALNPRVPRDARTLAKLANEARVAASAYLDGAPDGTQTE